MQETMLVPKLPKPRPERLVCLLACFASKECLGKRGGREVAARKLMGTEGERERKRAEGSCEACCSGCRLSAFGRRWFDDAVVVQATSLGTDEARRRVGWDHQHTHMHMLMLSGLQRLFTCGFSLL
jgi:hypothetical protein